MGDLNSWLDTVEEKISDIKEKSVKIIQTEQQSLERRSKRRIFITRKVY